MIWRSKAQIKEECKSSEEAAMESMTLFTKISGVQVKIPKCAV